MTADSSSADATPPAPHDHTPTPVAAGLPKRHAKAPPAGCVLPAMPAAPQLDAPILRPASGDRVRLRERHSAARDRMLRLDHPGSRAREPECRRLFPILPIDRQCGIRI